jgi:hypothetical protein
VLIAFILVGHVAALRVVPALTHSEELVGMPFISFVLDNFPFIFYPSLAAFSVSLVYHMAYGSLQILKKTM